MVLKKKEKKNIKNRKLKQKINNDHFLLRLNNTAFDFIFVQVIFSMLGTSSYNFENKEKKLAAFTVHGRTMAYSIMCKNLFVRIFLLF